MPFSSASISIVFSERCKCIRSPLDSRYFGMPLTIQPFAPLKKLDQLAIEPSSKNVGCHERIGSIMGGAALIGLGLARRSPLTLLASIAGGLLVYRGISGKCPAYRAMDLDTARHEHRGVPGNHGHKVERSVRINRSADDLFRFWRNLENVPKFMGRVKSVTTSSERLSHWVAQAPAGVLLEWDAEIINEHPGRMIAWQTLPGAQIESAGSVWFTAHGDGTEVKLALQYLPPAGGFGDAVSRIFGEWPERQLEEDLFRLKQLMEV